MGLKASNLSPDEYQKAKSLKSFNSDDWKWNPNIDLYIKKKVSNFKKLGGKVGW